MGIDLPLLAGLIWVPLTRIHEKGDIETWLELIGLFENELGENVFDHEIAVTAVGILCSSISKLNKDNLEVPEFAKAILVNFHLLLNFFHAHKQETLEALVTREIIHIQFRVSDNLEKAKSDSLEAINQFSESAALFILTAYLGRILRRNEQLVEAQYWLEKALTYEGKDRSEYLETLIGLASIAAQIDTKKSIEYCEIAVKNALNHKPFIALEYMQILAELGLAYYLGNEIEFAFDTYEILVKALYDQKGDGNSTEWIKIFSLTGHTTGYMASMMTKGIPPNREDGPYFTPFIGMFTWEQRDLSPYYNPRNDALIAAQMAFIADALNLPDKAYQWSLTAFDIARRASDKATLLLVSSTCSQYAVVRFEPEQAFESSLLFAAVSAHLSGGFKTKYESLFSLDLEELLQPRPSENWETAEKTTFEIAIIPLFLQVLIAYLENADYRIEWRRRYLHLLKDYLLDASDQLLWDLGLEISSKIIDRKIAKKELIHRSNTFIEQGKKHLQIFCMIGVTFISEDPGERCWVLINFIPYLQKLYGKTSSISKFILLPFVKLLCTAIIKTSFVGSKEELNDLLESIRQVNNSDPNAIQMVVKPAFELTEIKTLDDRIRWLYNYEEI